MAPAPQKHTGTGLSQNDELVNMNGPNAPGLGIMIGGCIHNKQCYIASSKWLRSIESVLYVEILAILPRYFTVALEKQRQ